MSANTNAESTPDGTRTLQPLVGLNDTNSKCEHYNWGDGYPSAYGARCEKLDKFFFKDSTGRLEPSCCECKKPNAKAQPPCG